MDSMTDSVSHTGSLADEHIHDPLDDIFASRSMSSHLDFPVLTPVLSQHVHLDSPLHLHGGNCQPQYMSASQGMSSAPSSQVGNSPMFALSGVFGTLANQTMSQPAAHITPVAPSAAEVQGMVDKLQGASSVLANVRVAMEPYADVHTRLALTQAMQMIESVGAMLENTRRPASRVDWSYGSAQHSPVPMQSHLFAGAVARESILGM
jgi:hypothetical protein